MGQSQGDRGWGQGGYLKLFINDYGTYMAVSRGVGVGQWWGVGRGVGKGWGEALIEVLNKTGIVSSN